MVMLAHALRDLDHEQKPEKVLEPDLCILDPDLMLIGRQVQTEYGQNIDLLALDVRETLGTGGGLGRMA
ncbi:MAG: hypothetical protein GVY18_12345 [Bacteroidetes bacterium]|jgi:hypothetical protein|nr:hypothetical protein [Bacteroidota bacterium]